MAETGAHSPLDQFKINEIVPLGGRQSFTNSSLMMVIALILISGFL